MHIFYKLKISFYINIWRDDIRVFINIGLSNFIYKHKALDIKKIKSLEEVKYILLQI